MARVEKARDRAFSFAQIFLTIALFSALVLVCTHPSVAGGLSGGVFSGYLGDIGYFMTSPFAKFVGAAAIICGVIMFIRGGPDIDGDRFAGPMAITAITIGALVTLVPALKTLVRPIGGGGGGGGSSFFPSITTGVGEVAALVVSAAVPVLGAIVLVGGLYRYSRDEHHVGLRTLGEIAIGIGVLCVGAGFLSSVGSGAPI